MLHPMIINDNRMINLTNNFKKVKILTEEIQNIMIIKLIIVKLTRSIISETGTEIIISLRKEKKRI